MTKEEKGQLILQLTKELVDEAIKDGGTIGGLMSVFGEDYIIRMETFAELFKGKQ